MKLSQLVLIIATSVVVPSLAVAAPGREPIPAPKLEVLERGPNLKRVQRVISQTNTTGRVSTRTNSYTELATGLHYQENGVWKESREDIEILPNGAGAMARQGGHKVMFAPNLNSEGVIDLETPDGKRLRSHVLGLGYYDPASGKSVLIAEVQDSDGAVVGKNSVIYTNAFAGVAADVRYTYRKSGFEQDVILRGQPPAPEKYGLSAKTTRLEVFTEFLNPPTPQKTTQAIPGTSLTDERLGFGQMIMGRGKAFPVGAGERGRSVPTGKSWIQYEGRTILIEEVEFSAVAKELKSLPSPKRTAAVKRNDTKALVGKSRQVPAKLVAQKSRGTLRLASAAAQPEGFVLDYILTLDYGTETDFTFHNGVTYLVTGEFSIWGTTTIEGGAVIKYAAGGAGSIWSYGQDGGGIVCNTTPERPAVFTAADDNSVGEAIENSSGVPSGDYANIALFAYFYPAGTVLSNLVFAHAATGVAAQFDGTGGTFELRHVQFLNCQTAIYNDGANLRLKNVLIAYADTAVDDSISACSVVSAENVTLRGVGAIINPPPNDPIALRATNCLFYECGLNSIVGDHNTWAVNYPFVYPDVLGRYYLHATGTNRNTGTTSIDPDLLTELQSLTTYAPPVSTLDTDTPDRGYHYPAQTDYDYDGIADEWEIKHFGTLAQTAAGDYDGNGQTNGLAFANNSNPNQIKFTLGFGTAHVNGNSATGSVIVLQGVPDQMAVLVNSTNFEAAVWQPFQTNVVASLGSTDGDYTVWVGVRGHASDTERIWHGVTITRDTIAPIVVITDPVSNLTSQPVIQLQGYGNEPLLSVRYDITNVTELLTNLSGYVTSQTLDTNTLRFTTNWFQCYDVALATNVNIITVRVTDLAGNVTMTNLNLTLDYSGDTNAPSIAVTWPDDNALVVGASFTLRGQVDDRTASVVVNLGSNSIAGSVDREGNFEIPAIPLAAATNVLNVIATDAAGNSRTSTRTVRQSSETVTLDPVSPSQLTQTTVTVSGTVGVSGQSVWINGVAATVNAHTWTATIPTPANNVANFDVQTGSSLSNPTAAFNVATDSPPQVRPAGYTEDYYVGQTGGCGEGWLVLADAKRSWSAADGPFENLGLSAWQEFDFNRHFSEVVPFPNDCAGDYIYADTVTRKAHTKLALQVGGSGKEGRTRWIRLTASVASYANPIFNSQPGDLPLSAACIQIFGQTLTPTATNAYVGEIFIERPAGSTNEIPISVAGTDNYSFTVQAEEVNAALFVDANHDGVINESDLAAISASKPFRFWINDDKDNGDVADSDSDIPGATAFQNWNNSVVNGRCDLIDFFPVVLSLSNVLQQLPLTNGYTYRLSHAAGAVNFVYTDLSRSNAFDYLTVLATNGFGPAFDQGPPEADTIHVTTAGVELSAEFLNRCLTNGNKGVILVEGRTASTSPLMLDIWLNNKKLASIPLHLSLSGVEQMYRWVNLRHVVGVPETRATDLSQPANYPDTYSNGKNFVFVHGYNVTEVKARYWNAEVFKRLWQSGSRAKFYAVDWHGNESYLSLLDITPDYHTNVVNAFLTAPALKDFLTDLNGETTVAGHSLGNMVCLSAISDWNAAPARYFMIDAAVTIEAIDDGAAVNASMIHPEWLDYTNRLWASEWHSLFVANDGRSELSWRGRLANFGSVNVYNFYSSGEEVLREDPNTPPAGLLDTLYQNALNYFAGQAGVFAWVWQEKTKGRMAFNGVSGSDHGGWKFNLANGSGYDRFVNGLRVPIAPEDAAAVSPAQLMTNAFFDLGNYTFSTHPDLTYLPGANGSTYAQTNRNRILADAVPALTLPIGANAVTALGATRNIDMQNFQNGWPTRPALEIGKWHHSDIRDVAYPYNYKIFNEFVNRGNLNQ